jgi:glucose/arabinose dehydrogenase
VVFNPSISGKYPGDGVNRVGHFSLSRQFDPVDTCCSSLSPCGGGARARGCDSRQARASLKSDLDQTIPSKEENVSKNNCLLLAAAAAMGLMASLPAAALDVKLEVVAQRLTHPLIMVSPPGDDRKFIVEQTGTIKILDANGKLIDGDFLNIKEKLPPLKWEFDEEGLLGIAFPPDFKKSGKFYIAYTAQLRGSADLGKQLWYAHTNTVSEMRVSKDDPNKADLTRERKAHCNLFPKS